MFTNRISRFLQVPQINDAAVELTSPDGFAVLPVDALRDVAERWNELRSMYEFAYSLAQVSATNTLPDEGPWAWS